jgi:hypothetical protein
VGEGAFEAWAFLLRRRVADGALCRRLLGGTGAAGGEQCSVNPVCPGSSLVSR